MDGTIFWRRVIRILATSLSTVIITIAANFAPFPLIVPGSKDTTSTAGTPPIAVNQAVTVNVVVQQQPSDPQGRGRSTVASSSVVATPTPPLGPAPAIAPSPQLPSVSRVPVEASADISEREPSILGDIVIYGTLREGDRGVPSVLMDATLSFQSGPYTCSQRWTDHRGQASCLFTITSPAAPGQPVPVRVRFFYKGKIYEAETSFTPR